MPLNFIGTLGAIITMRSIVPDRRTLLKIGMAGPIAGFIIALILSIIGFALSETRPVPPVGSYFILGDSLLFYLLGKVFYPAIPAGNEIFLHPLAFAGWVGLFVTSMNLIPIGQLDGGHVAYSVLLRKQRLLYIPVVICIVGMGYFWLGWIFWGVLAFLLARREPPIQDALTPLTLKEKLLALMPLVMLILTFIPRPFAMSNIK
jgi:membrane-associated protease RseP (regulator of RpoE activity)